MSRTTLHPKHGVNPTMGVCFWCGQEDGTIGLLGFNKDREAPKHTILSKDPCDKCKAKMAQGIALIEATDREEPGLLKLNDRTYATGRWLVVREEWVQRCIHPEALRDQVLRVRKSFIDREMFAMLMPKEPPTAEPA